LIVLDTNLAGDLDDATLNADDVVLEVAVPALTGCQCPLKVRFLHPSQDAGSVRVAAAPTHDGSAWTLELSIPLEALGLTGRNLVPEPGWVAGGLNPTGYREYHPRAGWVMGLAVAVDSYASNPTARLNDPTTWDTLVLMADR
jgi:hypothetical protein